MHDQVVDVVGHRLLAELHAADAGAQQAPTAASVPVFARVAATTDVAARA